MSARTSRPRSMFSPRVARAVAVVLGAAALAPAVAQADTVAGTALTFPANVTVGATGLAASVTLSNANTLLDMAITTNTVCGVGDASPPCGSPERGIVVIPSCAQVVAQDCATAGFDPGVFAVSGTGSGRLGSSCASVAFTISQIDPASGAIRLTPATTITLPPLGSSCIVDFTFDVLKSPADLDPGTTGNQTAQTTVHTQYSNALIPGSPNSTARATSRITVARAPTSVATTASAGIALGSGTLTDSATVNGRVAPTSGATVDFRLYGPADPTCSAAPVFTSLGVPYPQGGGAVASAAYTPTAAGAYRWVASYGGDANNAPSTGACGAAGETTVVARATAASIATAASAGVVLGAGSLSDSATVGGRVLPLAGATVDFRLYGPSDPTCSGTPAFQSLGVSYPAGSEAVTSSPFTPTQAGTYRWVATYSGDANNTGAAGACGDAGESTVVARATPTLATAASGAVALGGGTLTDTATVAARVSPLVGASVDFRLYGPGDATCGAAPVFESLAVPYPAAGGPVTSAAFTPTEAGTYRWVATYSGDANNTAASGACGDAGESTVVARATPTIATTASPGTVLGAGTLTDEATVNGRFGSLSGATVDFRLFGPGDPTCSATPVFESLGVAYPAGGGAVTSTPFAPSAAGTYRWVASYSGDAANVPASGTCGDAGESVAVTRGTPTFNTTASAAIVLGAGTLSDSAAVGGRVSPLAGATIDFRLYGPGDATCSAGPLFESLDVAYPTGGGPVTSAAFTPSAAGTYRWVATYSGDANNAGAAGTCGDAGESAVVARATPTIATTASGDVVLGAGTLSDSAAVGGRVSPLAGATIDFRLYGPGDATCSAGPVFESLDVAYPAGGGAMTSAAFTPSAAGTYRWVATYSGDANNTAASGACGDAGESTVVARATPVLTTTASPDVVLGAGTLTDTAIVVGRSHPLPGATIDFRLYGPDDPTCSTTPVFTSPAVSYPDSGGFVPSQPFTPTRAGTYRWIATYSGDANNTPVSGGCNDANETTVIARATPALSTTASPAIMLGTGTLTDTATVSGRATPLDGATIDFRLYGPDDASCSAAPVFTSLAVPYPADGGPVTSDAFTPTAVGTYRWVATYGGDANNAPVAGGCDDANETTVVAAATPTLTTHASPDIVLGAGSLTDAATVAGRSHPLPGATIEFRLYGPDDPTCGATPVFESLALPYPADGGPISSAAFTPTRAGTYRWTAAYSGDANNAPVAAACGDAGETTVVAPATPTLAATASPDIVLAAGTLTDTATVQGRAGSPPDDTIDFRLYGPDDPSCAAAPIFASLDVAYPAVGGPVTSQPFTPTLAGTYRWVAAYGGNANNDAVAGACNDPGQSTTVTVPPPPPTPTPTPTLAATASPAIALGAGTLTDTATVLGRAEPAPGATIDFRLYGPDDATCAAAPVFASANLAYPATGGPLTSAAFTPQRAGTYRWVARYGGDAANPALSGACDDAGQATVVQRAPTRISSDASLAVTLGAGPLTDGATVTGRVNPLAGATIAFRLYGPADPTCAGAAIFETLDVAYPAGASAVSSRDFTPREAGTYRWTVSYSGDANNAPAATDCGAPNTTTNVSERPTSPPPPPPPRPSPPPPADATPQAAAAATPPPPDSAPPAPPAATDRPHRVAPTRSATPPPPPVTASTHGASRKSQPRYAPYDPRSEPVKTVGILIASFSLLQLATSAGGLASAARRNTPSGSGTDGAPAGGGDDEPSYGLDYEGIEVEQVASISGGFAASTYRWPLTPRVDSVAIFIATWLAPRSPLLSRLVADGTSLRSIFGSASQLVSVGGLVLGILAVRSSGGEAVPPSTTLTILIAMISIIDAAAGTFAVLTFLIGIVGSGGVSSTADVRLMLGLAALWCVIPVLAGAARPLRRDPTRGFDESWERAADIVIATLVGAWAVQSLVLALPGLGGRDFPIGDDANLAAICVIGAMVLRMIIETVAAHLYPKRLEVAAPDELDEPGRLQQLGATAVRATIFVFLAYVIIGTSWQLYVAAGMFVVPQLLGIFADRFPNSERLYRSLPKGLVELVLMVFLATVTGALLIATMNTHAHDFVANSVVLLSLPGCVLALLSLFGRDGEEREIGWGKRAAGTAILMFGILLALGMLL